MGGKKKKHQNKKKVNDHSNKKKFEKKSKKQQSTVRIRTIVKQQDNKYKIHKVYYDSETRAYDGIMDPESWSPEGVNWCRDIKFESVLFIDECIIRSGISLNKIRRIQGESCRVLGFPEKYILTHRKDPEVLTSILEFISTNCILLERKLKLFLVTLDGNFYEDSNADKLFQKYGFKINFSILNISDLIALELQRLIKQKSV